MNEPTKLLKQFQQTETEFKSSDDLPIGERKKLYQARNLAQQALTNSLSALVPFQLLGKGNVACTVRTLGGVTSPGPMLHYSDTADSQYTFMGVSLMAVDEICPLE